MLFDIFSNTFNYFRKYSSKCTYFCVRNTSFGGRWRLGLDSNTKNTVKNIVNHAPPTTLALGDNSYQSTGTCWYNIVKPLDGDADTNNPKRLKITIGNHDDSPSSLLSSYKKHFHLNKLYYSVNREYVHILVLNSEDPNRSNKNSDQYKFVQTDLQAARNNSNIKWIIVEVHQPFFTSPNGSVQVRVREVNPSHKLINHYSTSSKLI